MFKNIVLVNDHCCQSGGAATVALTSARVLLERGYHTWFFCGTGDPPRDIFPVTESIGGEEIALDPNRIRAITFGIWNAQSRSRFRQFLTKLDPADTLIHLHGWVKSLSPSIVGVSDSLGFRSVITLHDYFVSCPNGGFYNYREGKVCRLQPMTAKCARSNCDSRNYLHKLWRILRQRVQNDVVRPMTATRNYIMLSATSDRVLRQHLNPRSRIFFVRNPIVPFTTQRIAAWENGTFLFIGRISPEKGADLFCEAARRVGARAVIVGDGPVKERLASEFPEHNFTGWLSRAEIAPHVERARALVFPSRWYEVQPLTPLEAIASGVPVITSDVCTPAEYIHNEEDGLVFRSESVESLADALAYCADDDARWRAISSSAYSAYWERASGTQEHGDDLESCYKTIWAETVSKPPAPVGSSTDVELTR